MYCPWPQLGDPILQGKAFRINAINAQETVSRFRQFENWGRFERNSYTKSSLDSKHEGRHLNDMDNVSKVFCKTALRSIMATTWTALNVYLRYYFNPLKGKKKEYCIQVLEPFKKQHWCKNDSTKLLYYFSRIAVLTFEIRNANRLVQSHSNCANLVHCYYIRLQIGIEFVVFFVRCKGPYLGQILGSIFEHFPLPWVHGDLCSPMGCLHIAPTIPWGCSVVCIHEPRK